MTKTFQRSITQPLSWLLAAMLLIVAVGGRSWSVPTEDFHKVPTAQKGAATEGAALEGTATDEKVPQQAQLSALSLDAVVTPAATFDFSQQYYILPPPSWRAIEVLTTVPVCFHEFFHFFSFFRNVFGHHIAINAP